MSHPEFFRMGEIFFYVFWEIMRKIGNFSHYLPKNSITSLFFDDEEKIANFFLIIKNQGVGKLFGERFKRSQ